MEWRGGRKRELRQADGLPGGRKGGGRRGESEGARERVRRGGKDAWEGEPWTCAAPRAQGQGQARGGLVAWRGGGGGEAGGA